MTIAAADLSGNWVVDSFFDVSWQDTDDDTVQQIYVPAHLTTKRYVRMVVDRGTQNAVLDGAIAVQRRMAA